MKRPQPPGLGRTWFNSGELSLASLRGRVVLIDFWDYTRVNCFRTLPYLLEWDPRYRDLGLPLLGVHAPEFRFALRLELEVGETGPGLSAFTFISRPAD